MKAVALITQSDSDESTHWQFDKIMSAIAYDVELTVVFMPNAIYQLTSNKVWKSLNLYGVDEIYRLNSINFEPINPLIASQNIDTKKLRLLIKQADLII